MKKKFDNRLSRHRGYGLIVCYLKENGPSRWSPLQAHICNVVGFDNRLIPEGRFDLGKWNPDLGPMRKQGRGIYSSYFSPQPRYARIRWNHSKQRWVHGKKYNPWKYFTKRKSTRKYHLTKRGRELYDHLQVKAAQGLDPQPEFARLWDAQPGDEFVIKEQTGAIVDRRSPCIIPSEPWIVKLGKQALRLTRTNTTFPYAPKPAVWFELDPGDELTYVGPCKHHGFIMKTKAGTKFGVHGQTAKALLVPKGASKGSTP